MTIGLLALASPRLPARPLASRAAALTTAGVLHLLAATVIVLMLPAGPRHTASDEPAPAAAILVVLPPHLVFVSNGPPGGGGGGGGNRQDAPVRHATGAGHDAITMRTARRPRVPGVARDTDIPPILLDALPLASGTLNQIGLPVGGVSYGTSTGPGSGSGVGTGTGTGIGEGRGPGIGSGSGGGFGGGAYRPGGAVTAPRLISQVKPRYTSEALEQKIQGSVWLDLVITREGRVGDVRVVRSLDPGGLDEEAISAARKWQFEPGRLAGTPVGVMVTVVMDFSIR